MPTPAELAKSGTEHSQQVALFAWAAMAAWRGFDAANDERCYKDRAIAESYGRDFAVHPLKWFHAIPNGGTRGDDEKSRKIRGGQLKAEGVRQGVCDTFLPYPNQRYAGLYLEMKKPSLKPKSADAKGGLSEDQIEFIAYAHANSYCVRVAYTWGEAVQIVQDYLMGRI